MELKSKLTLLYVLGGLVVGAISGFFIRGGWHGLLVAIVCFLAIYKSAPRVLKIAEHQFPGGRRGVLTSGILPFFLVWLIVWIGVYTYI